jgi:hypothetical protein
MFTFLWLNILPNSCGDYTLVWKRQIPWSYGTAMTLTSNISYLSFCWWPLWMCLAGYSLSAIGRRLLNDPGKTLGQVNWCLARYLCSASGKDTFSLTRIFWISHSIWSLGQSREFKAWSPLQSHGDGSRAAFPHATQTLLRAIQFCWVCPNLWHLKQHRG